MRYSPETRDAIASLQVLRSLEVLDTEPEERFDRITRLAQRVLGVDRVEIALLDENRVWRKSAIGLPTGEVPRTGSFASYATFANGPFVVADATVDPRFREVELVEDGTVVSYAGYPLMSRRGHRLGALGLFGRESRYLDEEELKVLEDLAAMVSTELTASLRANSDPMTHLLNRQGFAEVATHALSQADTSGQPVAMLVLEMDTYPSIAREHGVEAADEALLECSALLSACFRRSDVLARLEDARFCVLLVGATIEQVDFPVTRFEKHVNMANGNRLSPWTLSFSVGYTGYDRTRHVDVDALVEEAEGVMYALVLDQTA